MAQLKYLNCLKYREYNHAEEDICLQIANKYITDRLRLAKYNKLTVNNATIDVVCLCLDCNDMNRLKRYFSARESAEYDKKLNIRYATCLQHTIGLRNQTLYISKDWLDEYERYSSIENPMFEKHVNMTDLIHSIIFRMRNIFGKNIIIIKSNTSSKLLELV